MDGDESGSFDSIVKRAIASFPAYAVKDLSSIGVCPRCILRLFGVKDNVYSFSHFSKSFLCSVLERTTSIVTMGKDNDIEDEYNKVIAPPKSEATNELCIICFGILQFVYVYNKEPNLISEESGKDDLAVLVADLVKNAGYESDGFLLEVSVPSAIMINEQNIWSYMKNKYGSEDWYNKIIAANRLSVKDTLKLSITKSLENLLATRSAAQSFRIRMAYTHMGSSDNPVDYPCSGLDGCRKRKADDDVDTQSAPVINQDNLRTASKSLLQEGKQPCELQITFCKTPIYIGGRYLKYTRNVSQTRWIIDDERMGEASVEELIGKVIISKLGAENFKFHAAGREDIDVRMLGSGRPFLVEVTNAHTIPSCDDIKEIVHLINNEKRRLIGVKNVKIVGKEAWDLMREGEAEKQKQYAALVWISRPLTDQDLEYISNVKDLEVSQRTPIRVLHRRSPLERKRIIHWMRGQRVAGSSQYFMLHLCTQAGTYIKEFVHGDLGRTDPSMNSLLGCRAEILQLDVTDVKMECFNRELLQNLQPFLTENHGFYLLVHDGYSQLDCGTPAINRMLYDNIFSKPMMPC